MRVHQRIEVLRPTQGQHLEFPLSHQFLQITIDRTETDVGDMPARSLIDLIGRGMRVVAGNLVPHNFKLPGPSAGAFLHGTSYASLVCESFIKAAGGIKGDATFSCWISIL